MATFFANEDYVATNLCINKDHPEMHCNGQCQLDKKLHEDNDNQQTSPDKKLSFETTVFVLKSNDTLHPIPEFTTITPQYGKLTAFSEQSFITKTIHPPSI